MCRFHDIIKTHKTAFLRALCQQSTQTKNKDVDQYKREDKRQLLQTKQIVQIFQHPRSAWLKFFRNFLKLAFFPRSGHFMVSEAPRLRFPVFFSFSTFVPAKCESVQKIVRPQSWVL